MIIGTAGHIDHGKTALVRALTGVDTDRLPEEKRRGITIDLGFAPLVLPGVGTAGVVDVPGHDAFVRTMVAGATGIDVALLVVAADEGIMPQTREHVAILDVLGVRRGVVALTKSDLAAPEWRDLVAAEVGELLSGTTLHDSATIPVSVVTGAGLDALRDALAALARDASARAADDLVRLPIDRVFSKAGSGTVVTGTLWSGGLRLGDEVTLLPSGQRGRVRTLQTHAQAVEVAPPGTRVAAALAGVDRSSIARGEVLVTDGTWRVATVLRADVTLLGDADPIGPRTPLRLHLGTTDVPARVVSAGGVFAPGETRAARLVVGAPGVVARGGDRFVLRRASPPVTVGGGVITDPLCRARRSRPFAAPNASDAERLGVFAREAAGEGLPVSVLPVRIGRPPSAMLDLVREASRVELVGEFVASTETMNAARKRLRDWLARCHTAHPRDVGAPLESARTELRLAVPLAEYVLHELVSGGEIVMDAATIRLASWRPVADTAAAAEREALLRRLTVAGAEPPAVRELERDFGRKTVTMLRELQRSGEVVALTADRFAASAAAKDLQSKLAGLVSPGLGYRPTDLRPLLGLSRQFLIPWLEYFDRIGFSRREGDARVFRVSGGAKTGA